MRRWLSLSSLLPMWFLVTIVQVAFPGEKPRVSAKLSPDEQKLLDLTNFERKKLDLAPLKVDPLLMKLARAHSENMAKQEKLDHQLDCKSPFDRLKESGYEYQRAAENVAMSAGAPTMADILKLWMDSEPHRANILSEELTEIGVGIGRNDKGEVYATQVFASPFEK